MWRSLIKETLREKVSVPAQKHLLDKTRLTWAERELTVFWKRTSTTEPMTGQQSCALPWLISGDAEQSCNVDVFTDPCQ